MHQLREPLLEDIRVIYSGEAGRITVCRDRAASLETIYTCVTVPNGKTARELLALLETGTEPPPAYRRAVAEDKALLLLFEYREERRFSSFSRAQLVTQRDKERACAELVLTCMAERLPPPILYLALSEENLNLSADGKIYFNFFLQPDRFDPGITQAQCTARCAQLVRAALALHTGRKTPQSLTLLDKKINRGAYRQFAELYRDLQFASLPAGTPEKLAQKVFSSAKRLLVRFARPGLVLCACFAVAAAALFVSHTFFSSGFFAQRNHALDIIGTETLS